MSSTRCVIVLGLQLNQIYPVNLLCMYKKVIVVCVCVCVCSATNSAVDICPIVLPLESAYLHVIQSHGPAICSKHMCP